MARTETRRRFTRWHKSLGLIGAAFLVFLSVTGILLNHSPQLALDRTAVNSPAVLDWYGVELPPMEAVRVESDWITHTAGELFFNSEPLGECRGAFLGVLDLAPYRVVGCERQLLVYDLQNRLLEKVSVGSGLPFPMTKMAQCGQTLCLQSAEGAIQVNLDTLGWSPWSGEAGTTVAWLKTVAPPAAIGTNIREQAAGSEISWERVILDLHAGRFMGRLGPWIMDAVALVFLLLAVTGLYLWSRSGPRRSKGRGGHHKKRKPSRR